MKSEKKEMCSLKCARYAPTVLRVGLGVLFLVPGVMKLLNPAMVTGMLSQIFDMDPTWWFVFALTWVLIAVEIIGGLMLISGFKTKFAVPPLVIVMLVAIFAVVVPSMAGNVAAGMGGLLFHVLALLGLVSIGLSGPGACSVRA